MKTTTWNGIELSQMMLGTVQFGMPYGIANQTGQPDFRDVVSMIDAAVSGGVNCLDTAAAYGQSEEILGRALKELHIADEVTVVTKVRTLSAEELASPRLAESAIVASAELSLQRLQLDCLPIVLFHRECDAEFLSVLAKLRDQGKLRYFGVSCSNIPGAAADFVRGQQASAIQIPANIVDHRHIRSGVLADSITQNVAVFIRSVYLQGLLAMAEETIPDKLRGILPERQRLSAIAAASGLTLTELALRYLLSLPGTTSILTGVETREQVQQNLAMFSKGSLSEDIMAAIHKDAAELPELLITPSMWSM
jgi:aryl-alcohol dehydrogenase-like predicted oxidoreductase